MPTSACCLWEMRDYCAHTAAGARGRGRPRSYFEPHGRALGLLPVLGKLAEHTTIRRIAKPPVAGIPDNLLLTIPNGFGFVHPTHPLVIRRHDNEQVVKLLKRRADDADGHG